MTFTSAVAALIVAVGSVAGAALPVTEPVHGVAGATATAGRAGDGLPEPSGRWSWPLDPRPEVIRTFDPPDQRWLAGHRGADLRANVGQGVRSPAAGTVTFSAKLAGRGVVVVRHADGLRSTFEPVDRGPRVGTAVEKADEVGVVSGEPGHCAPATCLHWGVLRGHTYLDPLLFVGRAPIILLPLN